MKSKAKRSGEPDKGEQKTAVASEIVQEEYGNYWIKAGRLSGNFVARAFPKNNANCQGLMAEATGASEDDAIAALKVLLDEREAKRNVARRWEIRSQIFVPSKEEFVEAIRQTHLSGPQIAMLKAHALAGEQGLAKIVMMNASGYRSIATANKAFARAGAIIGEFLGVAIASEDRTLANRTACVLGFGEGDDRSVPDVWFTHEELRAAVKIALH